MTQKYQPSHQQKRLLRIRIFDEVKLLLFSYQRTPDCMPANRLSKVLAAAGVASRRACEELIAAGRVMVNGQTILLPQHSCDPDADHIKVDGKRLQQEQNRYYFVLNKPKGFICTNERPKNGRIVGDLFPKGLPRLFTVGRLDKDTTGLLIVTNDGLFANQVIHPSSGITKEYLVKVREELTEEALEALRGGAVVDDVFVRPVSVVRVRRGTARVTVSEGRKHEVRILVEKARLTLVSLERIRLGSIVLGNLPLGAFRSLTIAERKALLEAAAIGRAKPKRKRQIIVKRRERTENSSSHLQRNSWTKQENETMDAQDIGPEATDQDAIHGTIPDIQWEQVDVAEQVAPEGETPRRQKRAAFVARERGQTGQDRPFRSREAGAEGRSFPRERQGDSPRFPARSGWGRDRDEGRSDRAPRRFGSSEGGDRPSFRSNRPSEDGESRGFRRDFRQPRDRDGQERSWSPRPPRSFDDSRQDRSQGEGFRPRERSFGQGDRFAQGPRRSFNEERRPFNAERRPFDGERRPFNSERRPFDGERRSFNGEQRRPFNGERRPFDGERRSFNGERRFEGRPQHSNDRPSSGWGQRPQFSSRGPRPDFEGRREQRPFKPRRDAEFAPRGTRPDGFKCEEEAGRSERGSLKPKLWRSE
jgi:23S rRNA pseudouridine2605 synthase